MLHMFLCRFGCLSAAAAGHTQYIYMLVTFSVRAIIFHLRARAVAKYVELCAIIWRIRMYIWLNCMRTRSHFALTGTAHRPIDSYTYIHSFVRSMRAARIFVRKHAFCPKRGWRAQCEM